MKNTVIYYQQKENEANEESITYIEGLIKQLEKHYIIKGVFIDCYNDRSELYNFINTSPKNTVLIFNSTPLDTFDQRLLDEVARTGDLHIDFKFNK
ncbi:hypothetical protein [Bacillus sp. AFS017274]|uniref:hypothetical protein n=1 Tax=Bacillus sp. AFS017274 TaxID=2033488 RepID=UPI000BF6CE08|nr:hypothetical protein [Bacillus sp. AFS017274]PEZ76352.1 hypothetical protein CN380_21405 [Bacillus sp. AFS017274]